MKLALCQYSLRDQWQTEGWDVDRLCAAVAALGVEAVDLHVGLCGDRLDQPERVRAAFAQHGRRLAALAFGGVFTQPTRAAFDEQVARVRRWIRLAAALGVGTARIFGGDLPRAQLVDAVARRAALQQVIEGLGAVVREAEDAGVTLALENHGRAPGTSAEVLQVLGAVASPRLKATVDLGNLLDAGEEPAVGTAVLARHAAYVHVKGMRRVTDASLPWGWGVEATVPGEGDVDLRACFAALRRGGFAGDVAIEYEAALDERVGVPRAIAAVRAALAATETAGAVAAG